MAERQMHNYSGLVTKATLTAFALSGVLLASCSRSGNSLSPGSGANTENQVLKNSGEEGKVLIPSGRLPKQSTGGNVVELPDGNLIPVTHIAGQAYLTVEGTFSDSSYRDILVGAATRQQGLEGRNSTVNKELNAAIKSLASVTKIINMRTIPEVGYFRFLMPYADFESLAAVKNLSRTLLLSPVYLDQASHIFVSKLSQSLNAELRKTGVLTSDPSAFSGLLRIGVPEFEQILQNDIPGTKIDGSEVRVGVTDTGITYNHPSFFDENGNSRVTYMGEFTGEGTLFFSPDAEVTVRLPTRTELKNDASLKDKLFISGKYLPAGSSASRPAADKFEDFAEKAVRVSSELRARLLTTNNGARIAVFSEASFANADAGELVDINANGKTDDAMLAIYFPDSAEDNGKSGMLYLDISGKGDFSNVKPVRNFNDSGDLISSFQEKFGFDIRPTTLLKAEQKEGEAPINVIQAGIVGYDPGNHGSHVSGIIAGRKSLSNDQDTTLARGVAPNAKLMVNRVCANVGGCGALEALIDLSLNGAEIINMSLGGLSAFNDGYGVQETIINRLTIEKNTLFVISAGNSGPGRQTVGSPSVAKLSLSVGASASRSLINKQYQWPGSDKADPQANAEDKDFMLFFSSRGPSAAGGFKPSLAAPGTELSAIQLNAAPGSRSGLDVYWGTSMAAPTAAGAAALLLDAAKKYNAQNGVAVKLPTDATTIRAVLIESAIPFDVSRVDPQTGKFKRGSYTWIDQGQGLINLPRAWSLLKEQALVQAAPSVVVLNKENGQKEAVPLDYEVRILRKLPNGNDYTGAAVTAIPGELAASPTRLGPKFASGLWLDPESSESLFEVQIARRLPVGVLKRDDSGELMRQLNTSSESFKLETLVYGSGSRWLKAGVLNALDCKVNTPSNTLTIIGQGAVESVKEDGSGTSSGLRASNLYVCVNNAAIKALPPGDHGAIIKAYRMTATGAEAVPAFEIPVYFTKTHKALVGNEKYVVSGVAKSFEVNRNYVKVPEGTSVVNVKLEVPAVNANGKGCAAAELMAYEASNVARPPEVAPRSRAIASNCNDQGVAKDSRSISYSRFAPKAGVWDLHVFGRYQYAKSPYTLTVEYAKIATTISKITGLPEKLNGEFDLSVQESSFEAIPAAQESEFSLFSLVQSVRNSIKVKDDFAVPNADGVVARSYDETVESVEIKTYGSAGNDIDLNVDECEDAELTKCKKVASSGTSTDEETVTFSPQKGKFYKARVFAYELQGNDSAEFTLDEVLNLKSVENGAITVSGSSPEFKVSHAFDVKNSGILSGEKFTSGKYKAGGEIIIRTASRSDLARVPVVVSIKEDQSSGK